MALKELDHCDNHFNEFISLDGRYVHIHYTGNIFILLLVVKIQSYINICA